MPLITLVTRGDPETVRRLLLSFERMIAQTSQCLAWILIAGSSASTLTTLLFLYVLARFPSFIRSVKMGGADPGVIMRLLVFYQLNVSILYPD
jgi:hypothetical protein